VLDRYGALTKEQVAETAAAMTGDVRFGEAAVKLGFITRERLYQLRAQQTEEIAYAVLLVGDGMFFFLDEFDEKRIQVRQSISVSGLLMEGVRRMDEMRYFRDRIPSDQHVPARAGTREPQDEAFKAVWSAIDGFRSIAEICRVVGKGEFEVTQAIFQLVQSGQVSVHTPRPTGPAAVVALFNEAMSLILHEVDAVGRGGEVREQLASFATGAGVYDALFLKAGPAPDGTVSIERIIENIATLVGPTEAEATLSQWLYEYISFAVFVAEPFLRPGHEVLRLDLDGPPSSGNGPAPQPLQPGTSLSKRVAELVRPLSPKF